MKENKKNQRHSFYMLIKMLLTTIALLTLLVPLEAGNRNVTVQHNVRGHHMNGVDGSQSNVLEIGNIHAEPGDIITIELEMINDEEFVGFNLDIPLPEGFVYVDETAQLFRMTNHVFGFSILEESNTARLIAFSITNDPFTGNDGLLFSFDVVAPAKPGQYTLSAESVIFANLDLQNILTGIIDGVVTIEEPVDMHIAASQDVTVSSVYCFHVMGSIFVAGEGYTFTVADGGEATLAAGQSIRLLPGTIVESGGYLLTYIAEEDPCGRPFAKEELPVKDETIASIGVVDEADGNLYLNLYPNPAERDATIGLGNFNEGLPMRIEIFNLIGNMVLNKELPAQPTFSLDVTDMQAGMYVFRVTQGDKSGVARLIKR